MSQWTHVCGCIRVDTIPLHVLGLRDYDFENLLKKQFGETWSYDDENEEDKYDKCSVPKGSEGSIQYKIQKTGSENNMTWGLITIWGDLRDFDDPQEIFEWIKKSCDSKDELFSIRSCCVEVYVESNMRYLIFADQEEQIIMKKI